MAKKVKQYSEKDVSYFSNDVEKIRAKPNMYVGATDDAGVFHINKEAWDNVIDEFRAGRNKLLRIVHNTKTQETFTVDDGAGIPVKKHPKAKISTLTHIVTSLQSSGKINSDAYTNSTGTHGVGITAANALSAHFEVWTFRKDAGGWHHTSFEEGTETSAVKAAKKVPFKQKSGTIIRIVPSKKFFGKSKMDVEAVRKWCEVTSYLNSGLKVQFCVDGEEQEWLAKNGLQEYLDKMVADTGANRIGKKDFVFSAPNLEIAFAFTDNNGEGVRYYTNTIPNIEGGVHEIASSKAFVESIKNYGPRLSFTQKDLLDGVVGFLNYNIQEPQFDSQTKEKLVDKRVPQECFDTLHEAMADWFMSNRTFAKEWVKRASEIRKFAQSFLKNKKMIATVKKAKMKLSAKLADVSGEYGPEHCELFLVEGDSAGGSAKNARDPHRQAVFPLKGKPLNTMEADPEQIMKNEEIATILAALGIDIGSEEPTKKLPYGKIIMMADADVDGKHINTLLLTAFYRFAPDLFEQGMIFSVKSPEYLARHKGKTVFGSSRKSVLKKLGNPKGATVAHLKGWGEMDADDLRVAAMDPETRVLYQIKPVQKTDGTQFEQLMGTKADYRKKILGI